MTSFDPTGLADAIRHCFASVFSEMNLATEAWISKSRLLAGSDAYVDYMQRRVGTFPLFGTSRSTSVDEAYVSVTIATGLEREVYRSRELIEACILDQKHGRAVAAASTVDPDSALDNSAGGFALVGAPGSGKTTIFRHLALLAARGRRFRGRRYLPIYLAARDLAASNASSNIISAAEELLTRLNIPEARRVVDALMREGRLLLLLDGIDETSSDQQRFLIDEITELQSRFANSIFCVSARPLSLAVGLPNFAKWETARLTLTQRQEFARKWFAAVDPDKGQRLLERCANEPSLLDLGSSPLLLSIVCALFHNELDIPSEPDELYERAVHGLLGGWDAFRNVARQSALRDLSLRKRIILCTHLAAALFERDLIVFSSDDVDSTGCLGSASTAMQTESLDSTDVLHSLYNDFGVLVERSPSVYSFSHLTLHEYLVARYVVDNRAELRLLDAHRSSRRWFEVIRLTAKLLASADQFLVDLHRSIQLDDPAQAQLLASVWSSRPVCTNDTRVRLMKDLARRLAGASKDHVSRVEMNGETLIIYTRRHPNELLRVTKLLKKAQESEDDATRVRESDRREQKAKTASLRRAVAGSHDVLLLAGAAPAILRILDMSRLSYAELGVSGNVLFAGLQEHAVPRFVEFVPMRGKDKERDRPRAEYDYYDF